MTRSVLPLVAALGALAPLAASASGTAQAVFAKVSPSVVVVRSRDPGTAEGALSGSQGSGVVIAPGTVITNAHVVAHSTELSVVHEGRAYPAHLQHVDLDRDLCQLKVQALAAPAVQRVALADLAVGADVFAIGAPQGLDLTLSQGLISAIRKRPSGTLIQTSAAISKGSSGGGLFDNQGRLAGITTLTMSTGQNLNFAVPADWIGQLPSRSLVASEAEGQHFLALKAAERKQDSAGIIQACEAWLKVAPQNPFARGMLGDGLLKARRFDDAEAAYRVAAQGQGEVFRIFVEAAAKALGDVYMALHRYRDAIESYARYVEQLEDRFPQPAPPQLTLIAYCYEKMAVAHLRLGETDQAVRYNLEVGKLVPASPAPDLNAARALRFAGRYADALPYMKAAMGKAPGNPNIHFELGLAYLGKGDHQDALRHLDAAGSTEPWASLKQPYLGEVYRKTGRIDQALEAYEKAAKAQTGDPEVWGHLGRLRAQAKDHEGADAALTRYLQRDPLRPDDWALLGKVRMARKKLPEAAQAYRARTALRPKDASSWYRLGVCLGGVHEYPEAIAALKEAARLRPRSAKVLYRLGLTQAAGKDGDGVRKTLAALAKVDRKAAVQLQRKVKGRRGKR